MLLSLVLLLLLLLITINIITIMKYLARRSLINIFVLLNYRTTCILRFPNEYTSYEAKTVYFFSIYYTMYTFYTSIIVLFHIFKLVTKVFHFELKDTKQCPKMSSFSFFLATSRYVYDVIYLAWFIYSYIFTE